MVSVSQTTNYTPVGTPVASSKSGGVIVQTPSGKLVDTSRGIKLSGTGGGSATQSQSMLPKKEANFSSVTGEQKYVPPPKPTPSPTLQSQNKKTSQMDFAKGVSKDVKNVVGVGSDVVSAAYGTPLLNTPTSMSQETLNRRREEIQSSSNPFTYYQKQYQLARDIRSTREQQEALNRQQQPAIEKLSGGISQLNKQYQEQSSRAQSSQAGYSSVSQEEINKNYNERLTNLIVEARVKGVNVTEDSKGNINVIPKTIGEGYTTLIATGRERAQMNVVGYQRLTGQQEKENIGLNVASSSLSILKTTGEFAGLSQLKVFKPLELFAQGSKARTGTLLIGGTALAGSTIVKSGFEGQTRAKQLGLPTTTEAGYGITTATGEILGGLGSVVAYQKIQKINVEKNIRSGTYVTGEQTTLGTITSENLGKGTVTGTASINIPEYNIRGVSQIGGSVDILSKTESKGLFSIETGLTRGNKNIPSVSSSGEFIESKGFGRVNIFTPSKGKLLQEQILYERIPLAKTFIEPSKIQTLSFTEYYSQGTKALPLNKLITSGSSFSPEERLLFDTGKSGLGKISVVDEISFGKGGMLNRNIAKNRISVIEEQASQGNKRAIKLLPSLKREYILNFEPRITKVTGIPESYVKQPFSTATKTITTFGETKEIGFGKSFFEFGELKQSTAISQTERRFVSESIFVTRDRSVFDFNKPSKIKNIKDNFIPLDFPEYNAPIEKFGQLNYNLNEERLRVLKNIFTPSKEAVNLDLKSSTGQVSKIINQEIPKMQSSSTPVLEEYQVVELKNINARSISEALKPEIKLIERERLNVGFSGIGALSGTKNTGRTILNVGTNIKSIQNVKTEVIVMPKTIVDVGTKINTKIGTKTQTRQQTTGDYDFVTPEIPIIPIITTPITPIGFPDMGGFSLGFNRFGNRRGGKRVTARLPDYDSIVRGLTSKSRKLSKPSSISGSGFERVLIPKGFDFTRQKIKIKTIRSMS